jgi:hypothetical protein
MHFTPHNSLFSIQFFCRRIFVFNSIQKHLLKVWDFFKIEKLEKTQLGGTDQAAVLVGSRRLTRLRVPLLLPH